MDGNESTYTLTISYHEERDSESIESLTKDVAREIARAISVQVEAKKDYATIEVDKNDFYIFRLIDIKNISSIDIDEE